MVTQYSVGSQFPGAVPTQQGPTLVLDSAGGLVLMIQYPGASRREVDAFHAGLHSVGYLGITTQGVPLALWTYRWPAPMGIMDAVFDARIDDPRKIAARLDESEGLKNALLVHLLDRQTLIGNRLVGLAPELVRAFHATIREQLAIAYSRAEFNAALAGVYAAMSPKQMLERSQLQRIRS